MSRAIIVAGFHRSGTSLVAEGLWRAGVFMGDALMPPTSANPRGHFEDCEVYRQHERMLRASGTTWLFYDEVSLRVTAEHEAAIQRFVQRRESAHTLWGVKEPRICLFIDAWLACVTEPTVVVVYRHWADCAASILAREARVLAVECPPLPTPALNVFRRTDLGVRSWLSHNRRLIDVVRRKAEPCVVVSHAALLQGYPVIQRVGRMVGSVPLTQAQLPVERGLVHHRSAPVLPGLERALVQELNETWEELQGLSEAAAPQIGERAPWSSGGVTLRQVAETLKLPNIPEGDGVEPAVKRDRLEPATVSTCLLRAKRQAERGMPQASLLWAEEASNKDAGSFIAHSLQARARMMLGDLELAERSCRRALALAPASSEAAHQLAGILAAQLRDAEASQVIDELLARTPDHYAGLLLRAQLSIHAQDWHAAEDAYRRAADVQPDAIEPRLGRARVYFAQGAYQKAAEAALDVLRTSPDSVGVRRLSASLSLWASPTAEMLNALECVVRSSFVPGKSFHRLRGYLDTVPEPDKRSLLMETVLHQLERFNRRGDDVQST